MKFAAMFLGCALASPSAAMADAFDVAADAYDACYTERLVALLTVCEPAETVATAVVAGCSNQLKSYVASLIPSLGMADADKMGDELVAKRKQQAIAKIIEFRSMKSCN